MARGKLIAATAAAAVVAAGLGYGVFGVYLPRQAHRQVQSGVEGWSARWAKARACLLGPSAASSRTSEAVAIRELSPDPWDRGTCTAAVGALSRGDVADSGEAETERAWDAVDHAATVAATAFANHVGGTTGARDALPSALDALDDAAAALRRGVGLPPAPSEGGAPLPAALALPLALGDDPVVGLEAPLRVSSGGLVGFGVTRGKRGVEVVLRAGQAPVVAAVHAGVVRSGAAPLWGAQAGATGVDVGPIDASGVVRTSSSLPLPHAVLLGVVGDEADGTVVYGAGEELWLARGAAKTSEPGALDVTSVFEPAAAALLWRRHDTTWRVLPVLPGAPIPAPVIVVAHAEVVAPRLCLAGRALWLELGGGPLLAIREVTRAVPVDPSGLHTLLGCTPTVAVVRIPETGKFAACGEACEVADLDAPPGAVATAVGGQVVAVDGHGAVLAVRQAGRPRRFVGVGAPARPIEALSDDHTVDVLAEQGDRLVVLRLP